MPQGQRPSGSRPSCRPTLVCNTHSRPHARGALLPAAVGLLSCMPMTTSWRLSVASATTSGSVVGDAVAEGTVRAASARESVRRTASVRSRPRRQLPAERDGPLVA
jgi:hypothetical protein